MSNLLTAHELAKRLKVKPETIKAWARSGRIPVIRFSPKVLRFDPDAVEKAAAKSDTGREGGRP